MGIFDFLKRKADSPPVAEESVEDDAAWYQARAAADAATDAQHAYWGKAEVAGSKAQEAVAAGKFNVAWGLLNEQKQHYLQHSARCGFTKARTLELDSGVSQPMANILRLEGKHLDALVHIVYWVAASTRVTKSQQQKLPAYFNRCKFKDVSVSDLNALVEASQADPDFVRIRNTIGGWRDRG